MWSVERVAERFHEAAQTARRLPPVRVQGYVNTWPAIPREPWETYAAEDGLCRFPPDPATIERMEGDALGAVAHRRTAPSRVDARRGARLARDLPAPGV
jgi:Domain of unknown function (DUF6362)